MMVNEKGKVLDVKGGQDKEMNEVWVWGKHGGTNQKWDIIYMDMPEPKVEFKTDKPFIIVNQMKGKRLLTLSGTNFVIKNRENSPEQLFKFDMSSKTIKLYANQQDSIAVENHGRSRNLIAHKTDGAWYQEFHIDGNQIKNARGLVIDVAGARDADGSNVIVWKKHGNLNQQWKIEYVNADIIQNGIIPDKPFKIITKMGSARALTRSRNNVIIRDNKANDKDQIFVYDSQTGSIQPRRAANLALDIGEQGRNRYVQFAKEKDIWYQHFQIKGEQLVNERGLVLDVAGGKDQNNQNVLVWKKHNGANQKWKIDYI